MSVRILRESLVKKPVVVKYHGKLYYINRGKLNNTLNRMGMCAKFDFVDENMRDFLVQNKLLYTEFLESIREYGEICR